MRPPANCIASFLYTCTRLALHLVVVLFLSERSLSWFFQYHVSIISTWFCCGSDWVITLATKIMDEKTSLPSFDCSGTPTEVAQRWKKWLGSFEYMAEARDISAAKRLRSLLLHTAGPTVQDLYEDLPDPLAGSEPSGDNVYKKCVRILSNHFQADSNPVFERHTFRQMNFGTGESTAQFVVRLRNQARLCDFGDKVDDMIRDQLVSCVVDVDLRRKLLENSKLTLAKCLNTIKLHETTAEQAAAMHHGGSSGSNDPVDIHAVPSSQRITCFSCGRPGHRSTSPSCPAKNRKCHQCGRTGHFAKQCRSKSKPRDSKQRGTHQVQEDEEEELEESFDISHINQTGGSGHALFVTVTVNGHPLKMEVDTGANVALVPESVWQKHWKQVELQKSSMELSTFDGSKLPVVGKAVVCVEYGQQQLKDRIIVVRGGKHALLGRNWLQQITLDWPSLLGQTNAVSQDVPVVSLEKLAEEYPSVFAEGLGTVKGHEAKIRLKNDATPKCCRARPMPYALREAVDKELDRLEQEGIIKPVDDADWASPIVVVEKKKSGSVRICADFKVTINLHVEGQQHPIPNPTDLLAQVAEGSVFTTLDLSQAYAQLPLDEDSKRYCVISTHRGLYAYQRMPFGVASAPSIWQRTMDKILCGLPGVVCFFDDVLVVASSVEEHDRRLRMVLQRLAEYGIRLRQEKCVLRSSKVRYLGYNITAEGLQTSEDKVSAIVNARAPENVAALQSFLGLVNFCHRFIPNLSTVVHPLHQLLRKDVPWHWSKDCEEAFSRVKQLISTAPVLAHYDMSKQIVLECDASPIGIGACLWQVSQDGTRQPVHFVSRSLATAEAHYSQIEREALAIVFAVKRLHSYLHGRRFTLRTDHRPLLRIFGNNADLPATAVSRLQRWRVVLSAYDYDLEYIRGCDNVAADCLSRLPQPLTTAQVNAITRAVRDNEFPGHDVLPVSAADIALASKSDSVISAVMEYLKYGWPTEISETLKPLYQRRDQLTIEAGCLIWNHRTFL